MTRLRLFAPALAGVLAACGGSSSGPPAPPVIEVRATARGPNELLIEWDPVSGSSYVLLRDGAPISPPVASPSWLDLDVRAGTTYRYEVEARRADGTVAATGTRTAATPPTSARWLVEDVYPNGGVGQTSARAGADGTLHVVVHDAHAGAAVYGRDDGAGLVFEEITRGEFTGRVTALAVDADGVPHVALGRDRDLVHAERDPSGHWTITPLWVATDPQAVAIAVDGAGDLHVVQRAGVDASGLRYSSRAAGTWSHRSVPAFGPTIGSVDLAVTGGGDLAVLYFAGDLDQQRAALSVRTGGVWQTASIAPVDLTEGAICGDETVGIHLALFVGGRVVVTEFGGPAGQFDDAGDAGIVPRSLDLAVSPFGDLHIALHGRAQDLVHLLRFDGRWSEEFVDADGDVGEGASIALAPDGRVDIVYNDAHGGGVRRAQGD